MQVGDIVEARVLAKLNYGFVVAFGEDQRGILKFHLCSTGNAVLPKGTKIKCKVHKITKKGIDLTDKDVDTSKRDELFQKIETGQVYDGIITNICDYGLFVNIGEGLVGLVHKTELGFVKQDCNPHQYKSGDTIKCSVIGKEEHKQKVQLSVKALLTDPWDVIPDDAVGSEYDGVVVTIQPYGIFVLIKELGFEGLLHSSKYPKNFSPSVGMELKVVVECISTQGKRISLLPAS